MLYTYELLCLLMARKTCPNETITVQVQLHNKHVVRGKERPRYRSARSPKTTPYKVHFLSLTKLKLNKAVGLDKVSPRLLKDAADIVLPSLTSLFNISINIGCFPSTWKLAKISPLFKKGSKQDPSNYRPISVLPTISKLPEKAVHMQLYSYLCDNNLLSQKQFGFRLNSSTVIASAMFTDKILPAMDKGELTAYLPTSGDLKSGDSLFCTTPPHPRMSTAPTPPPHPHSRANKLP